MIVNNNIKKLYTELLEIALSKNSNIAPEDTREFLEYMIKKSNCTENLFKTIKPEFEEITKEKIVSGIEKLTELYNSSDYPKYPGLNLKRELCIINTSTTNPINQHEWLTNGLAAITRFFLEYLTEHNLLNKLDDLKVPTNQNKINIIFPQHSNYYTQKIYNIISFRNIENNSIQKNTNNIISIPFVNFTNQEYLNRKNFDYMLSLIDKTTLEKIKNNTINHLLELFSIVLKYKDQIIDEYKIAKNNPFIEKDQQTEQTENIIYQYLNFQAHFYMLNIFEYVSDMQMDEPPVEMGKFKKLIQETKNIKIDPDQTLLGIIMLFDEQNNIVWNYNLTFALFSLCISKFEWFPLKNNNFKYRKDVQKFKIKPINPEADFDKLKFDQQFNGITVQTDMINLIYQFTNCIIPKQIIPDEILSQILKKLKLTDENRNQLLTIMAIIDMFKKERNSRNTNQQTVTPDDTNIKTKYEQIIEKFKEDCDKKIDKIKQETNEKINSLTHENQELKQKNEEILQINKNLNNAPKSSDDVLLRIMELEEEKKLLEEQFNSIVNLSNNNIEIRAREIADEIIKNYVEQNLPENDNKENNDETEKLEEDKLTEYEFPYINQKRIIVYGGHDNWRREMEKLLPNVKFIDKDSNISEKQLRQNDVIWIQWNAINHPLYRHITKTAKAANIPFYLINYASPKKGAEQIVKKDLET